MTTIPRMARTDAPERLAAALDEAGCLVVTGMQDSATRGRVREELAAYLEAAPVGEDDPQSFYPGHTRRVTALIARSATVREIVQHPTTLSLCDAHLGDNCERYHVHVTAALAVGPGARSQVLHREEDPFTFFSVPRPNLVLATMTAITDFTRENGGTLLVPGSHRWEAERKAEPHEIVAAEMPAGATLFWLGGTLHGAGANTTEAWRYGVILTYSLGWLRQEENQYLDLPVDVVAGLSPALRDLTGITMHGSLGFFDPTVVDRS